MALSDWDFYVVGQAFYELSIAQYVSPPSSLGMGLNSDVNYYPDVTAICKVSSVNDLKQGTMITWFRDDYTAGSQGFVIGFEYGVKGIDIPIPDGTSWTKYRVVWWNSYNYLNEPKLAVRLDTWNGSSWVLGSISYGNARLTGNTNRCGLYGNIPKHSTNYLYWDDTEIWGP